MARAKKYKLKINEDSWTYSCLRDSKFDELHGDCGAITDLNENHIDFRKSQIDITTIVHEVSHAYFCYLRLSSATDHLNLDAVEEIACEFIGADWNKILDKAYTIYANLDNKSYNELGYCKLHQALLDLKK